MSDYELVCTAKQLQRAQAFLDKVINQGNSVCMNSHIRTNSENDISAVHSVCIDHS